MPRGSSPLFQRHSCPSETRRYPQDLSRRYIAELNKPRIKLPSLVGFVGAVGVGFVVGG